MSDLPLNNFERTVSGMGESVQIVRRFARLAILNGADPVDMANILGDVASDLTNLTFEIKHGELNNHHQIS